MDRARIKAFYAHDIEARRLDEEPFRLEGIRTRELIGRYLGTSGLGILDVGGGAGYYAFWLQEQGHDVTLVDLSPRNIELARKQAETSGVSLKQMQTGDAVALDFPDGAFDMVLLLGPLYHLTEREERIAALREARRVLKPGGLLLSAVISRHASLFDGFKRDLVIDDRFYQLLHDDLQTGIHINNSDNLEYFTTAYFHTPAGLKEEIVESGLQLEKLIGIESFGWFVPDFDEKCQDAVYMEKLLNTIRTVESNEDLLAMSPHIMAVARRE